MEYQNKIKLEEEVAEERKQTEVLKRQHMEEIHREKIKMIKILTKILEVIFFIFIKDKKFGSNRANI